MKNTLISKLKSNDYLYFFSKLLVLLVIVFFLDFVIGKVLRHFYFTQDSGLQYRTTYSMEKTRAGIIVFGSSRANHHYHPDVFEEKLPYEFYNAGKGGTYNLYHYAVLKSVLKRHKPEMVLLEFGEEEFKKSPVGYDRLSALLPYYQSHPEIREILKLKSKFEELKLNVSQIYPFNSSIFAIAIGNTEINKSRWPDIKGYLPLENQWNEPLKTIQERKAYEIDTISIWAYESFLKDCTEEKVPLYVISSPYLRHSIYTDTSMQLGKTIADKYGVPFFDYSHEETLISKPELFFDYLHLNDKGARVFSEKVIDWILKERESADSLNLKN